MTRAPRPFCRSHRDNVWHIAINMDADQHVPMLCGATIPGSPYVSAEVGDGMALCTACTALRSCVIGDHEFTPEEHDFDDPYTCTKCGMTVTRAIATRRPEATPKAPVFVTTSNEAKLRANLIRAGRAVGSLLSDEVSTGFLCGIDSEDGGVGREVELVMERYQRGLRWIALGIVGRQHARPDFEGQPFTDWQLAGLLLEGIDIHGLVAPRKT